MIKNVENLNPENYTTMKRKFDPDERLINFAAAIIDVSEA